jgi:hypothetical protein
MSAGGVEGGDPADVGPLAHRALRHAEILGRLAERQPFRLPTARPAASNPIPKRHRG